MLRKIKLHFIRFECRGHGKSSGKFEDFTISDWKKDLIDVIDNIAKGPQILVGSSMGGWLMFLAAKARPSRSSWYGRTRGSARLYRWILQ